MYWSSVYCCGGGDGGGALLSHSHASRVCVCVSQRCLCHGLFELLWNDSVLLETTVGTSPGGGRLTVEELCVWNREITSNSVSQFLFTRLWRCPVFTPYPVFVCELLVCLHFHPPSFLLPQTGSSAVTWVCATCDYIYQAEWDGVDRNPSASICRVDEVFFVFVFFSSKGWIQSRSRSGCCFAVCLLIILQENNAIFIVCLHHCSHSSIPPPAVDLVLNHTVNLINKLQMRWTGEPSGVYPAFALW